MGGKKTVLEFKIAYPEKAKGGAKQHEKAVAWGKSARVRHFKHILFRSGGGNPGLLKKITGVTLF